MYNRLQSSILIIESRLLERRRGRVVKAARLRRRKSPQGREFEAGLRHATTGQLSLSTQQ